MHNYIEEQIELLEGYMDSNNWERLQAWGDEIRQAKEEMIEWRSEAPYLNYLTLERLDCDGGPQPLVLYRGIEDKEGVDLGKGFSWTRNRKVAEWFATRYGRDGKVMTWTFTDPGFVEEAVLWFDRNNKGGEWEVIVDPIYIDESVEAGEIVIEPIEKPEEPIGYREYLDLD